MFRTTPSRVPIRYAAKAVVLSDGLVLPFDAAFGGASGGAGLLDWRELAVRIPEARANETVRVLREIPTEAACRMQARLRDAYSAHLASFELQLDTLLTVLDRQRQPEGRARGVAGV